VQEQDCDKPIGLGNGVGADYFIYKINHELFKVIWQKAASLSLAAANGLVQCVR